MVNAQMKKQTKQNVKTQQQQNTVNDKYYLFQINISE